MTRLSTGDLLTRENFRTYYPELVRRAMAYLGG